MPITTIVLSSNSATPLVESPAGESGILPGHLLCKTSTGDYIRSLLNGRVCLAMIAVENTNNGKGVGQAYAFGDIVYARVFRPGDVCYIYVIGGQILEIGTPLESNGLVFPGEFSIAPQETPAIFCSLENKTTVGSELVKAETRG